MRKLVLAMMLMPLMASANTENVNGIWWTYTVTAGKAQIGTGNFNFPAISTEMPGAIKIPSTLGGCPVTSIGDYAFWGCSGLTSVTIPEGVTSIGEEAFYYCYGLTSVTIPEGVTSIGDHAFYDCSGMTSVTIPSSVTSIGDCAFDECSGLMSVTIPSCVAKLSETFPDACGKIKEVVLCEGVTSIGDFAFKGCGGLTSVTIPSSVTNIGYSAFASCKKLTSMTIPSSVTSIGDLAFSYCSGLTSVTIQEGVTSIGVRAFEYCSGLTSVTIPSSVMNIKLYAFLGCSGLGVGVVIVNDCVLTVNGDCPSRVVLPEGTRLIAGSAFADEGTLTSITMPTSMTTIGDFAFDSCGGLTSVMIPEGVTSIGLCAFSDCSGLTLVTIPSSVTNIGASAFFGCSGLGEGVVIVDGCVLTVNGSCPSKVILPEGVRLIAGSVFAGERTLTSITMPTSVTTIGDFAFDGCSGLISVTIPEGVTSIGRTVFLGCSGLTSVTIPSSVTSIGDRAFDDCGRLKTIYVDQGDGERVKRLCSWPIGVSFVEIGQPTIVGDERATVTGDAETGFAVKPSEGKTVVEVMIPDGIDAGRVTVEVSVKVESVKPNGAKVKIVNAGADITEFLNVPAADGSGVVDLTKATVKEEIVREVLDTKKGAKIELCSGSQGSASPTITTAPTRAGLFYQLREGETIGGMRDGDSTVGDGQPWSPEITVKGGNSAFYSIGVGKGE